MEGEPRKVFDPKGICPGIRGAVAFFRANGFETTDSGDGSYFKMGMEGAMEEPMVAMKSSPDTLARDAQQVWDLIDVEGRECPAIEATYYVSEDTAIILVYGKALLELKGPKDSDL